MKGHQFEVWGMRKGRGTWGRAAYKLAKESTAKYACIERCKPGVIDCDWKLTGNLNAGEHAKRRCKLYREAVHWGGRMDTANQ